LGVYQFIDDYTTWLNYPFFKQVKPMKYWRDSNKDKELDKTQLQLNQIFDTHFHRGSNAGVTGQHM